MPAQRAVPSPAVQLVTGAWADRADLGARVEAALRGGIRWVQLRARERGGRDLHEAATVVAPLARRYDALLVVNDRVDVALAVGADGVHLPESGLDPRDARRLLGKSAWLARSVHSADAIRATPPGLLDAVQFGPVFDTASKRPFGPPQGLRGLEEACRAARAADGPPVIAVGGIRPERARACHDAGASAVAVVGAIWDAEDIEAAASAFTRG